MKTREADKSPDRTLLGGSGGPGKGVLALKLEGDWLVLRDDNPDMLVRTHSLEELSIRSWNPLPLPGYVDEILQRINATRQLIVITAVVDVATPRVKPHCKAKSN